MTEDTPDPMDRIKAVVDRRQARIDLHNHVREDPQFKAAMGRIDRLIMDYGLGLTVIDLMATRWPESFDRLITLRVKQQFVESMVAAGQADLAITYQPQLHLQVHEGLPLTRVATLVATPLNCLTVMADGPVQSVADLKGRKIGYSVPGMETALMGAMLDRAGLSLDDVELVNVGWSLSPALMTGQVDATLGGFRNFEMTQMRLAGGEGRCLFLEEEGLPAYDELIFVANPDRMDRERINRFLSAVERGTQFILNHPAEAQEVFAAHAPDL